MTKMPTKLIDGLQWYAVRMVAPGNGHRRSVQLGADYERYRTRSGRIAKRRVHGTGKKVFVPELILQKNGFDVFLPVKKVWQRKSRYGAEKQLVSYPLVADWLFVGWPVNQCRWADLRRLSVVTGILGSGGRPIVVTSEMMSTLQRRWGGDNIVGRPPKSGGKPDVRKGDMIRITDGPFEDFQGEVVDVTGAGARVMLSLFGRDTPLDIQLENAALVRERRDPDEGAKTFGTDQRYCTRCSGTMVPAVSKPRGFHVRCRDCNAVAALNSESFEHALQVWTAGSVCRS